MIKAFLGALLILFEALYGCGSATYGADLTILVLIETAWCLCLYYPAFLPLWVLTPCALVVDFLLPAPPGFVFAALLLVYLTAHYLRHKRSRGDYLFQWSALAALLGGLVSVLYALECLQAWHFYPVVTILVTWCLGMGVYPLFIWLCSKSDTD